MELKELIAIFQKQAHFFFGVVLLCLGVAFFWQVNQRPLFQSSLLLNIGRTGAQETTDYTYDSFYRLQADERFADTVVRWLAAPRVVEDIYNGAHLRAEDLSVRDLKHAFSAGRLSSQMIEVSYAGPNEKVLSDVSASMMTVLNHYTESLNKENREKNWFVIIGNDPVVRDGRIGITLTLLVGLAVGLFIGFWGVLLRHYFQSTKGH